MAKGKKDCLEFCGAQNLLDWIEDRRLEDWMSSAGAVGAVADIFKKRTSLSPSAEVSSVAVAVIAAVDDEDVFASGRLVFCWLRLRTCDDGCESCCGAM